MQLPLIENEKKRTILIWDNDVIENDTKTEVDHRVVLPAVHFGQKDFSLFKCVFFLVDDHFILWK